MSQLGKQLEALKAAEFLKREKPQDSAEAIEFMDFKARHPELLARFQALSKEELVDSRMLHRLRVVKALERKRSRFGRRSRNFLR